MIPNVSMKMSGASSANSTADAPSSPRSRPPPLPRLPMGSLSVHGLERFVERHRILRRSLLDHLVAHAQLAQPEAALDEPLEAHEVDGGSGVRGMDDRFPLAPTLTEQGHRRSSPGSDTGCFARRCNGRYVVPPGRPTMNRPKGVPRIEIS